MSPAISSTYARKLCDYMGVEVNLFVLNVVFGGKIPFVAPNVDFDVYEVSI